MSEVLDNIDNQGYCEDCDFHNCLNCNVMNELFFTKYKIFEIIEEKKSSEYINDGGVKNIENIDFPICGSCGNKMKKSKFKKGPKYWCSCKF